MTVCDQTVGGPAVRLVYLAGEEREVSLGLPGCEEFCPLPTFLSLTHSLRPADWQAECSLAGLQAEPTLHWASRPVFISCLLFLMLLLVATVMYSKTTAGYSRLVN